MQGVIEYVLTEQGVLADQPQHVVSLHDEATVGELARRMVFQVQIGLERRMRLFTHATATIAGDNIVVQSTQGRSFSIRCFH